MEKKSKSAGKFTVRRDGKTGQFIVKVGREVSKSSAKTQQIGKEILSKRSAALRRLADR